MNLRTLNLIKDHVTGNNASYSIGCIGALAEFQSPGKRLAAPDGVIETCNSSGGLRLESKHAFSATAYETLSMDKDAWQCGVVLHGERRFAKMSGRSVLTELFPDETAIQEKDRAGVIFDLGLDIPHIDFCIRSTDAELIAYLRNHLGTHVIRESHPVLERIIDDSPHRIMFSAVGRIEVYQRIDRHISPIGCHTHLLPTLLAKRHTHTSNIPLPKDHLPVLTLHPENPLKDSEGQRRPFSKQAFDKFESILIEYGKPEYVQEKLRLRKAINGELDPNVFEMPTSRLGRLAIRIALRQLIHSPPLLVDPSPWIEKFGS